MSNENKQLGLIKAISEIIYPLKRASADSYYRDRLFSALGWDFKNISGFPYSDLENALSDISDLFDDLEEIINNPPESLPELLEALQTTKELFTCIENVKDLVDAASASILEADFKIEFKKIGKELFNFLICGYLQTKHPKLFQGLSLLGIIEAYINVPPVTGGSVGNEWIRKGYTISEFHFNRIGDLFANPKQYFKDMYFPSSGELTTIEEAKELSDKLFPKLQYLFLSLGFEAWYSVATDLSDDFLADDLAAFSRTLTVAYRGFENTTIGFTIFYEPEDEGGYGLVIRPFGDLSFDYNTDKWLFKSKLSASIEGFAINADGVQFPTSFSSARLMIEVFIARLFQNSITKQQVGSTNGTRLEIGGISLNLLGDFGLSDSEYGGKLNLHQLKLIVGKEGDGFMNKLLPNGAQAEVDLGIGWTNKRGLHFEGSGVLEIFIAKHIQIGPLALKGAKLGVGFKDSDILIYAGATIAAKLGIFDVAVEDVGLKLALTFPASGGNLGKLNYEFGFAPPKGIGLKVDGGKLTGGGFLSIDPEKGRYVGALQLSLVDKFDLTALAIITTKAPDGSKGFTLLAMLNVEFEPAIELGLGFSLSGLGGLLAVNRRMSAEAIRLGVKSGAIDRILFPDPEKFIENVPTIVRDLEGIFPTQKDRYVIGLFCLINWGVSDEFKVLDIKLGILAEFPSPIKLAIIGTLGMKLPENEPTITLKVAFAGFIDLEKKYLSFDASIYDSKIMTYSLSGDMAVRLFWGDRSELLLSVGGFHPSYTPPSFLLLPAKMERMTILLFDTKELSLKMMNYFAVTSNTAQFGARIEFLLNVKVFKVIGLLGLDVLFQFNPFKLIAQIEAMLAVFSGKRELLSVAVKANLEGPGPWHAWGTGEFRVLGMTASANFDENWGPAPKTTLPEISVEPLVRAALTENSAWRTVISDKKKEVVSLKKLENVFILHPSGQLIIGQKIAPLGIKLSRYGTQKISDSGLYNISEVKIADEVQITQSELEQFAPANYREMNDDQKLKSASFEYLRSGVRVNTPANIDLYMDNYIVKEVKYDRVIIDKLNREKELAMQLNSVLVNDFVSGGVIGTNDLGAHIKKLTNRPILNVNSQQEKYQIVSKDSLEELSTLGVGLGPTISNSLADVNTLLENILKTKPGLAGKIQAVPVY